MNSTGLSFVENESKSGTLSRLRRKGKQTRYKKLTQTYSTQKNDQNECILKKNESEEIKYLSGYLQSLVSNDTNISNRAPDKCVSEMKGKKNKVRLQNNHLTASAICNDYLSKKLNSVDGLPKINSEQSAFSDKDDIDVFFFDLSGNKIGCSSDSRTKNLNNGSVLSLSPQDIVSLRKNKQKPKKNNITKQKYRNDVNSNNYENFDDIEIKKTAYSNYYLSKKPRKTKRQNQNRDSDSSHSKSFTQNEIMEESSNQITVKRKHFENKLKKSISKEKSPKKAFDFEMSFESLLESKAQSTPIQSKKKYLSHGNIKERRKMKSSDDVNGEKNCDKEKRKGVEEETKQKPKRRRSNSGDRIYWYTSSSDDNKECEKGSDISLNFKRKKRKSEHNIQQNEPDISISNNEIYTAEHNNIVDFSGSQLIYNQSKKQKKKKKIECREHSSLQILSENQEIYRDTDQNHNKKHQKSKSFDNTNFNNESRIKSELDLSCACKETVDMSSENIKTRDGEESFLQRPNDEQELYSSKSNKLKKKKHKRKHSDSKCVDGAELKYKSENDSIDEVFSTENIDEQRVESPNNTKTRYTKKYPKSKFIDDSVKDLKIDSSESELNISHSFSQKKRRHTEINTVNSLLYSPQEPDELKLECPDSPRNYTEEHIATESAGYEEFTFDCKIEFSGSELDLSDSFEKKNKCRDHKSLQDVSFIKNDEKNMSALEENSQIKSKKKKKHKADSSLDDLFIVAEEKTPTKRNVTSKLNDYEHIQSQNKTSESLFEKKKKIKKLDILDNGQQSIEKWLERRIPDSIYEPNCENHRLLNEMNSTSPLLENDMKGIQNSEGMRLSKNKSSTNIEHNTIEGPINTVHEPDCNTESPNMKEELDISYNDLKKFNNSESSDSDVSEKTWCKDIRKINEDIRANMDSEHDGAEVLKNLNIALPFTIPPLHINLERPSRPSLNEINASKNFKVKLGAYSKDEDQIIKNNWERFCKEHDLTIEPGAFFKLPNKMKMEEKVKFLQYISHGLENRLPHRVHNRFKTLFGNMVNKTGRFTEEEDKQILEFMEIESSKTPFIDLATILNRPSNSIERHYKRLRDQQKLVWTLSEADQLINCMLKVAKLQKPEQLKDWKFTTKQWKKISKKMEGVPVIKLQRAWNITIYPRLFASGNLALTKKLIIDVLDERQETDWRLIDWKKISKKFPGFSSEKLYMMFKKLVIFNVPKHLQKDIRKCIEYLKNKRIATPHKFRKYKYKNGHLVYEDSGDEDNSISV